MAETHQRRGSFMFTIYHSNRLEVLADQLAALLRQPMDSPFVPETIIVQSLGMARWLSFHLVLLC
jgi:exodeoxyribonuclease V gamma subunit